MQCIATKKSSDTSTYGYYPFHRLEEKRAIKGPKAVRYNSGGAC